MTPKHLISRKVAFDWDVKAPALFLLKSRCILTGPRFQVRGYSPDVGVGNAKEYLGAFGRTQEWDLPTQLSSGGVTKNVQSRGRVESSMIMIVMHSRSFDAI